MILSNASKTHFGSATLPTYQAFLVILPMSTAPCKVVDSEFLTEIKNIQGKTEVDIRLGNFRILL
jgi:hypothetical protein